MSTSAQIAANRENARNSTGPLTPEGRDAVSKNALKTGLTGRTVLLPGDDQQLYARHLESFKVRYNPVGDAETELVQSLADTAWRIARIPSLEAGIYAVGRARLADLYSHVADEAIRASLIETEVYLQFERQLRNLGTQEGRLRRQREKDEATLKQMQESRVQAQKDAITQRELRLRQAACGYIEASRRHNSQYPFDLSRFGSEFTFQQIEQRALEINPTCLEYYRQHSAKKVA